MEKILFATDFSECAANAFNYALHTCKITKAKLEILAVIKGNDSKTELFQKQFDELLQQNEVYILDNNIKYQTIIKNGNPVSVIEEHINSTSPNLVIIGSRGRDEVKGSNDLLGKIAKKIISFCKVPLLCVPTHIKFKSAQNIVFITNRLQNDYFAIIQLLKFASIYNTKIIIAHIHDNQGEAESNFKVFYEDLSELLNYQNFEFRYFGKETYIEGINKLIKEYNAEALALVFEKQSFFERLFNPDYLSDLLVNDYIPLLTLPE